jgi:hypothetical protein
MKHLMKQAMARRSHPGSAAKSFGPTAKSGVTFALAA